MRTLILFALLVTGMVTNAQSLQPSQVAVQPYVIMNTDSIAVAVTSEAVGLIGKTIFSAITIDDGKEKIFIGNVDESGSFSGLIVEEGGKTVVINANNVLIIKPSFNSHLEADAALQSGQEYYLIGDRGVYRKP